MLMNLEMKASPFAKAAGIATTTLTRFLTNEQAPVLSTSTLVKLRETRDRLLRERKVYPNLDQLTKDPKKQAIIALVLRASDDQIVSLEKAISALTKPTLTPPKG